MTVAQLAGIRIRMLEQTYAMQGDHDIWQAQRKFRAKVQTIRTKSAA